MNHEATIATLNMQLDNCAKDLYEKDKRIAELERQLEEAEDLIAQTSHGAAERISEMEARLDAALSGKLAQASAPAVERKPVKTDFSTPSVDEREETLIRIKNMLIEIERGELASNFVPYLNSWKKSLTSTGASPERNIHGPLMIARIKRYREVFGCTLKEAKEAVEFCRDLNSDQTAFLKPPAAQAPVREVPEGMPVTQEPKYGIRDNRLFNRASGEFIPEDEPVFIFRARDRHAIYAIAQYKGHFLRDESHKDAVGKRIQDFRNFMEANPARMKEPDTALPAAPVQQEGEKP